MPEHTSLNLRLGDFLCLRPQLVVQNDVLITMLDSSPTQAKTDLSFDKWQEFLSLRAIPGTASGAGLIIRANTCQSVAQLTTLLTHFDEIYIFKDSVPATFKTEAHYTSDRACFSSEIPQELEQQFCSYPDLMVFCADGDFLNVAYRELELPLFQSL